jgi:hypothetical protein
MRKLIAWVFMYSLDGLLADEGTEGTLVCVLCASMTVGVATFIPCFVPLSSLVPSKSNTRQLDTDSKRFAQVERIRR